VCVVGVVVELHVGGNNTKKHIWGKCALGLGILSIAIFTLLTTFAATYVGARWLIGLCFLESIGEEPAFPGLKLHKTIPEMKHNKNIVK
jgi:hypothetical protein